MMIDTTTIKVGDKVRLRNGQVHTVMDIKIDGHIDYPVDITFVGKEKYRTSYAPSGKFWVGRKDPWDIVEIIPVEASTSSRDGLGSHSHSFILEKPKKQYVWKATVQYHGSKDGGWSREINEVHYFTDPTCMESLSKLAFDNCGSITVERYELLQRKE
jgi:hypothetical protein